ncbi:regulatory GntR family protein [Actinocorallia herbida]|uniref:Regulatory GntR family protein n=1 Tax=Actinocorallia herbida TaxID=58109 RepID=A0A3N1D7T1_9ACTN|nr:GntR family transcriptional regulator [Actinocorallia herbida]ROO89582.1 regulatory GntR family protein [Actinocorallia herbida]
MSPTAWGAYSQIADTLRTRITEGTYAPGAKLPSESALCTEFTVTRNTIRRALTVLENEGLLITTPGTGRTVRHLNTPTTLPIPAYRRIADALRRQIAEGVFPEGTLLPSESALMTTHRVSRGTARQALSDLQGAGLIESHHGKGRYVRRRPQTP